MSGGSQRRRLACALLEQEKIARARNVVRIRIYGSGSEKIARKWLLELASVANVSSKI